MRVIDSGSFFAINTYCSMSSPPCPPGLMSWFGILLNYFLIHFKAFSPLVVLYTSSLGSFPTYWSNSHLLFHLCLVGFSFLVYLSPCVPLFPSARLFLCLQYVCLNIFEHLNSTFLIHTLVLYACVWTDILLLQYVMFVFDLWTFPLIIERGW